MEKLEDKKKDFLIASKMFSEIIDDMYKIAMVVRLDVINNLRWKYGNSYQEYITDDQLKYAITIHNEFREEYYLYLDLKDTVRVLSNMLLIMKKYDLYVKV